MSNTGWKTIELDAICEYARVLQPHVPTWSNGDMYYTIAMRLAQQQYQALVALGYKGTPRVSPNSNVFIYNFKRPVLSKNGNPIVGPEVLSCDLRNFNIRIGDGSRIILCLEYGGFDAGTGNDGSKYAAGNSFRIGAIQVLQHVEFVEEVREEYSLVSKFKSYARPQGYPESASQNLHPQQVQPQQVQPQQVQPQQVQPQQVQPQQVQPQQVPPLQVQPQQVQPQQAPPLQVQPQQAPPFQTNAPYQPPQPDYNQQQKQRWASNTGNPTANTTANPTANTFQGGQEFDDDIPF